MLPIFPKLFLYFSEDFRIDPQNRVNSVRRDFFAFITLKYTC